MIAFERFEQGHEYLSEKLFIPLEYGAVPAYYGNGHRLMESLTVNPKSFLDRTKFPNDQAFAEHIVSLLFKIKMNYRRYRTSLYFWILSSLKSAYFII